MLSKAVESVLSNAIKPKGREFGGGGVVGQISDDLKQVQDRSRLFQYLAAVMIVVLFVAYLILLALHHNDTVKFAAYSSVFGISIAGLIATMIRMADGQAQSGILLSLISGLPQDEALPALKAILDHNQTTAGQPARAN